MLSQEKIGEYEEKLKKEKIRLLEKIEEESKPVDFGNDIDHLDEESDESEEFQNQMGIAQTLKERVNEIDMALNRIRTGAYGRCEKCGSEIPEKVLKIAPESNLCAKCKRISPDD